MDQPTRFQFKHGIGDCVYLAVQLELYRRRGYRFELHCHPHREPIFTDNPAVKIIREDLGFPAHAWTRSPPLECVRHDNYFLANKGAVNVSRPPLPDIGPLDENMWNEMIGVRVPFTESAITTGRNSITEWLRDMPRPIILFHTNGTSLKGRKNIEHDSAIEALRCILDGTHGTVIFLDWHGDSPRVSGFRIRHLKDDFGLASIPELISLFKQSHLLIGIDSGPAHLARFTDIPVLVVWYRHHPATFAMPKSNHVHLVPKRHFHETNLMLRSHYNILEVGDERIPGHEIARIAIRMLKGERYLGPDKLGHDIQLQQFILDWSKSGLCGQGTFVDRDRSFDLMVKHLLGCCPFRMVETGTIRQREDWSGAGYSTYLFGRIASLTQGHLVSVDIDPAHCAFSRLIVECFGSSVEVVTQDSVRFLSSYDRPIDLLYLDSMDLGVEGFMQHGLAEGQAGYRLVNSGGLIVYDDTHFSGGVFRGKGGLGVPWLIEQGCEVIFSGHQTILRKR